MQNCQHKVLILAQGSGSRWEFRGSRFLGIPKQLVKIDGETLISRARRLFLAHGCEVVVIAPDDERFGARFTLSDPFPTGTEQDKFIGTQHLWNSHGRTVIAWGDCYYTEDAVRTICRHDGDDLHYFRRPWASKTTGHKWDESFAVSFGTHEHERVLSLADKVVNAVRSGYPKKDHIRTHYAASLGVNLDNASIIQRTPGQTVIDDWTDDFDRPDEWLRWVGRYYKGKVKVSLCCAWRQADEWRDKSLAYVAQHYGLPIIAGTAEGILFNRSAARNAAINKAFADGAEVAFVIDTDTIVSHDQLWAASYLARETGQLVLAFDEYTRLTKQSTISLLAGRQSFQGDTIKHHASGAIAIPRSLWDEVGGYDERFGSWGGEDRALWLACNAVRGRVDSLRVPGVAYHLWHQRSPENNSALPCYQDNIELAKRYKVAAGVSLERGCLPRTDETEIDLQAMRDILREPGGPQNMRPSGRLIKITTPEPDRQPVKAATKMPTELYRLLRRSSRGQKGEVVEIETIYVKRLRELGVIGDFCEPTE
jgi:hypothetical protein